MRLTFYPRFAFLAALLVSGCAAGVIPNTEVPDLGENRKVVEFVERYRKGMESRDFDEVLALVSERYFDENATPEDPSDDVDYDKVKDLVAEWSRVIDLRFDIHYRAVEYEEEKIRVIFSYSASFKLQPAEANPSQPTRGAHQTAHPLTEPSQTTASQATATSEGEWKRVEPKRKTIELIRESGSYKIISGL